MRICGELNLLGNAGKKCADEEWKTAEEKGDTKCPVPNMAQVQQGPFGPERIPEIDGLKGYRRTKLEENSLEDLHRLLFSPESGVSPTLSLSHMTHL